MPTFKNKWNNSNVRNTAQICPCPLLFYGRKLKELTDVHTYKKKTIRLECSTDLRNDLPTVCNNFLPSEKRIIKCTETLQNINAVLYRSKNNYHETR